MIAELKLAGIAAAVLASAGLVWGIVAHFNEFERLEQAERTLQDAVTTLESGLQLKETELALEKEYGAKRAQMAQDTATAINAIQEKTRRMIEESELRQRASTDAGRQDLNRRAAERWVQTYDQIRASSDYSDVYGTARPGPVRPDDRMQ